MTSDIILFVFHVLGTDFTGIFKVWDFWVDSDFSERQGCIFLNYFSSRFHP